MQLKSGGVRKPGVGAELGLAGSPAHTNTFMPQILLA